MRASAAGNGITLALGVPAVIAFVAGGLLWRHSVLLAAILLACATLLYALSWYVGTDRAAPAPLARNHGILQYLRESAVIADPRSGAILEANDAFLRLLGYLPEEIPHLTLRALYVDLPEAFDLELGEAARLLECRMRARDGRLIDTEITLTALPEELPLICIVGRDASWRKQLALAPAHAPAAAVPGTQDVLLELPTRAFLHYQLPTLLQRAAAANEPLALLHIDLDHFDNINNSRGHALGDRLLGAVAARLAEQLGPADIMVRLGGDEFGVLAFKRGDPAQVRALAQQILDELRTPFILEEAPIALTASIGIASYPHDGLDVGTLLKHASLALHEAKERGRDNVQLFTSALNTQLHEHVVLEQALRSALDSEQIHVEYQPIVDLASGLVVSLEALARWRHPELGAVPPGCFIPVAEKSGLIVPLGERIVEEVVRQLCKWQRAGVPLTPVSINVAPLQFERTEFATFVHELALRHDLDPKWLAFEVTESAWLQNSSKHVVMIDTLRHAGSRVHIDDFGTGFSNLSYLKTLPVDAVKIDQSFVRAIETDASDAAIVASIVAVAATLGLDTIAEGIETAAQAEKLRALGCRCGQGYYFSKPMPASQCRALLEQLGDARRLTETVKVRAFRPAG